MGTHIMWALGIHRSLSTPFIPSRFWTNWNYYTVLLRDKNINFLLVKLAWICDWSQIWLSHAVIGGRAGELQSPPREEEHPARSTYRIGSEKRTHEASSKREQDAGAKRAGPQSVECMPHWGWANSRKGKNYELNESGPHRTGAFNILTIHSRETGSLSP